MVLTGQLNSTLSVLVQEKKVSDRMKNRTLFCFVFFSHCSHIPAAFLVSVALFFQTQPSYMRKACKPNKSIILELRTEHKDQSCRPFHARSKQNKHGWIICTLNYLLSFLFVLLSHLCSVVSLRFFFFPTKGITNQSDAWTQILVITIESNARVFALLLFTYQHKDVSQNLWLMLFSSDPPLLFLSFFQAYLQFIVMH